MTNKVVFIEPYGTIVSKEDLERAEAPLGYFTAKVSLQANLALRRLYESIDVAWDIVFISPWDTNSYPIGVIMGSLQASNRVIANLHIRDSHPENRVLNWLVANPDYTKVIIITPDGNRFPKFNVQTQIVITETDRGLVKIDERYLKS